MSDFKKYDPYAINAIRLVDSRDLTTLHNRIAELEALLKQLDDEQHDIVCDTFYAEEELPCTCGHDAVVAYFKEIGE